MIDLRRLIPILLLAALAWGQGYQDTQYIRASAGTITIANPLGAQKVSFTATVAGYPTSTTVVLSGCTAADVCTQLASDAIAKNGTNVRALTTTPVYDHFKVTATWSGGSGVFVTIQAVLSKFVAASNGAVWTDDGKTVSPPPGRNVSIATTLPVTVSTSTPVTVERTGLFYCNRAGCTYNLPTITAGLVGAQMCFRNAATRSGAITLDAPADTYIDVDGANGTAGATLVSSGALGDRVCVEAVSTTQYVASIISGTWTNN